MDGVGPAGEARWQEGGRGWDDDEEGRYGSGNVCNWTGVARRTGPPLCYGVVTPGRIHGVVPDMAGMREDPMVYNRGIPGVARPCRALYGV
jgi:hypothetical protein